VCLGNEVRGPLFFVIRCKRGMKEAHVLRFRFLRIHVGIFDRCLGPICQ